MKSKRLLILLAPLTLGVNAATLSESVAPSISGQEVIPNAEPQIPQPQATSDLPSQNAGIAEEQKQNATTEVAQTEALPTQVVPQPADIPLPETVNEADLVSRMFDRDVQDPTQTDNVVSEPAPPVATVQSTIPVAPPPPPAVPQLTEPVATAHSAIPEAPKPPQAVPQLTEPVRLSHLRLYLN